MTTELDLAEGFAGQVECWALSLGASSDDARAARDAAHAVSLATSGGHVCLALAELGDAGAWRARLQASGVVGSADAPGGCPLVLDGDDRLYLHRYFDYERRLARRLVRALAPVQPLEAGAVRRQLDALFDTATPQPDWQKLAAALALRGRLCVISGGPGTGKTTTVVKLLACLIGQKPDGRIALAAPTGKAAARMTEAIRQRAAHLPEAIRARMPAEAFTIHRLLQAGPAGFGHHAGHLLAIDTLFVDEASMLDLALATQLLEAVPDAARIVLLGDKDQLAAVEAGAVFAELSVDPSLGDACRNELAALTGTQAARIVPPVPGQASPLRDAVVWFSRNYRFEGESAIGRFASAINRGDAAAALGSLGEGIDRVDELSGAIDHTMRGYAPLLASIRGGEPPPVVHAAFARFRALCALRDGPRGVEAVNAEIERRFRRDLGVLDHDPRSAWYPGRPVLVRRNDHVMKLFNGDVGIALPDADGALAVWFAQPDGHARAVAPVRLPAHETAFAMTVHQAQGSEFEAVLVLLPAQPSRVMTRELLYTAVTRAQAKVAVCGSDAVLSGAIEHPSRRHSGLLARLREAAREPHGPWSAPHVGGRDGLD